LEEKMEKIKISQVINQNEEKLVKFTKSKTLNEDDASELLANIYYEIYISLLTKDQIHNHNDYIFKIAWNVFKKSLSSKKKKAEAKGATGGEWLVTYSDLITLLMCFFLLMFNPDEITQAQIDAISTSMRVGGIGSMPGGFTTYAGRNADLGNTIMTLPSMERGRVLGMALRKAVSVFSPEIHSNKIKITHDERGLVITLAGDAFFYSGSARINIEETRDILLRLGTYLASDDLKNRDGKIYKFRIEGHTDSDPVDPNGQWEDNWQLSVERSRSVLRYLSALGIEEYRFQIAGFSDTVPVSSNDIPEGRRLNRRVDVIILNEGHL
jgi:chemotaxis protein MotB